MDTTAETWVMLPDNRVPEQNKGIDKPCYPLKMALYGHPDAGTFWEKHCNEQLASVGFEPVTNWPSCFFHRRLKLLLTVYVDDFKMAGWKLIRSKLTLEEPAPANLYLGCNHERAQLRTATGTASAMIYNMESYLASTVKKYIDVASKATGKAVKLKNCLLYTSPSPRDS